MTLEPDHLMERRRLKRKVTFWRVAAVITVIALVIGLGLMAAGNNPALQRQSAHIAKVSIEGVILGEQRKLDLLRKLEKSESVKGVVLSINSPGGATSGGEALYDALVSLGKKKPVVASMDGMAASAGYMIALPSERIFARRSSITGSIGVIFQYTDLTALMKNVGVEMRSIKSAPLKAEPNPFSQRNPEAEAMIAKMIDDSYQWFVGLVAKHRPFDIETAFKLADGRVVTGGQAVELKLVDELGGPEKARDWLIKQHKLDAGLKMHEWRPEPLREELPFAFAAKFVGNWLPKSIIEFFETTKRTHQLDGLVSVWQAQKSK